MALFERAHAVFCNNLAAQIEEPVLAGLIDRIARDEVRHEEFFANLVAHCLDYTARRDDRRDRRPRGRDRGHRRRHRRLRRQACETSPTQAFSGPTNCGRSSPTASPRGAWPTSPRCGSSSAASQRVGEAPGAALRLIRIALLRLSSSARLRGGHAPTRVASLSMASDMLCCPGGASRLNLERTAGPGPGAAAPAESSVRAARASSPVIRPRAHGWRWGHHPHAAAIRAMSSRSARD